MASRVVDRDRGYKALLRRVFQFHRPQVVAGIQEADGAEPKALEPGEKGTEDVTVLDVGTWNEFGAEITLPGGAVIEIPERSFIRAYFDQASPELRADLVVLMKQVVAGKRTKEQVLELIGMKMQAGMQARIAQGIAPANAPSTIARKGSSKPLIATGQLRSAITHATREKT